MPRQSLFSSIKARKGSASPPLSASTAARRSSITNAMVSPDGSRAVGPSVSHNPPRQDRRATLSVVFESGVVGCFSPRSRALRGGVFARRR